MCYFLYGAINDGINKDDYEKITKAKDLKDLKKRLGDIVVGYNQKNIKNFHYWPFF